MYHFTTELLCIMPYFAVGLAGAPVCTSTVSRELHNWLCVMMLPSYSHCVHFQNNSIIKSLPFLPQ